MSKLAQLQTIVEISFCPTCSGAHTTTSFVCVCMCVCVCVCVCFVSSLQVNNHHLHNVKRFAWKHWPAANLVPEQQQQQQL
jgi:accessory gene regulator protein AgrB